MTSETRTVDNGFPLVIPTHTQSPTARLILRNDLGQVVQQWLIRQNKCTLGSSAGCGLRCELPGIAPYHALLVVGARQTFVRALAPKLTRDGLPVNEILLTDENSSFEIAGHPFELNRNTSAHETKAHEVKADGGRASQRMKFTLARPFELDQRKGRETAANSKSLPSATAGPSGGTNADVKWVAQLVQSAIEPLECQLHNLLAPMAELQQESRQQRELRKELLAEREHSHGFPSAPQNEEAAEDTNPSKEQLEEIAVRQSAAMDVITERISDVNQQLSAIERIVIEDREIAREESERVYVDRREASEHQNSAIEQLQSGMVSVSNALQDLETRQQSAREEDQVWKVEIQEQITGLRNAVAEMADQARNSLRDESLSNDQLAWKAEIQQQFSSLREAIDQVAEKAEQAQQLADCQEPAADLPAADLPVVDVEEALRNTAISTDACWPEPAESAGGNELATQVSVEPAVDGDASTGNAFGTVEAIANTQPSDSPWIPAEAVLPEVTQSETMTEVPPETSPGSDLGLPVDTSSEESTAEELWVDIPIGEPLSNQSADLQEPDPSEGFGDQASSQSKSDDSIPAPENFTEIQTAEIRQAPEQSPNGDAAAEVVHGSTLDTNVPAGSMPEPENEFQDHGHDVLPVNVQADVGWNVEAEHAGPSSENLYEQEPAASGLELPETSDRLDFPGSVEQEQFQEQVTEAESQESTPGEWSLDSNSHEPEEFYFAGESPTTDFDHSPSSAPAAPALESEPEDVPSQAPITEHHLSGNATVSDFEASALTPTSPESAELPPSAAESSSIENEFVGGTEPSQLLGDPLANAQLHHEPSDGNPSDGSQAEEHDLPSWWTEDGSALDAQQPRDAMSQEYPAEAPDAWSELSPSAESPAELEPPAGLESPAESQAEFSGADDELFGLKPDPSELEAKSELLEPQPAAISQPDETSPVEAELTIADDSVSGELEHPTSTVETSTVETEAPTSSFDVPEGELPLVEPEPGDPQVAGETPGGLEPTSEVPVSDEDSVEDYMKKLLARMRGVPEEEVELPNSKSASVAPPASVSSATAGQPVSTEQAGSTEQAASADSQLDSAQPTQAANVPADVSLTAGDETDPFDPDTYVPRGVAPEKVRNLAAMRELANSSARTAISKSTRQRHLTSVLLKVTIVVVGLIVGSVLIAINGLQVNIGLVATVAAFLVSGIWGYDAVTSIKPLLQSTLVLKPERVVADQEAGDSSAPTSRGEGTDVS